MSGAHQSVLQGECGVCSLHGDFRFKTRSDWFLRTLPLWEVQEYPAGTTVLVRIAVQDQEADLVLGQMRMLPASADHYREEKYGGHC